MSHVDLSALPGSTVPPTLKPHREQNTEILLPKEGAFLNPVQQFNRDLSVAVIRGWSELRTEELEAKWSAKKRRFNSKGPNGTTAAPTSEAANNAEEKENEAGPSSRMGEQPKPPRTTILEALSATGLRSIRYAKEIPNVKVVLANDLSPSACEAMRRNVAYNGVAEPERLGMPWRGGTSGKEAGAKADEEKAEEPPAEDEEGGEEAGMNGLAGNVQRYGRRDGCNGSVRVNEGDAV